MLRGPIKLHTDNACIELSNGRLRTECSNENWFLTMDDARSKAEAWRREDDAIRPHSSLGNLTPGECVQSGQARLT
jgi:putative transposase